MATDGENYSSLTTADFKQSHAKDTTSATANTKNSV